MGLDYRKHGRLLNTGSVFGPIDTPEELLAIKVIGEKTL